MERKNGNIMTTDTKREIFTTGALLLLFCIIGVSFTNWQIVIGSLGAGLAIFAVVYGVFFLSERLFPEE